MPKSRQHFLQYIASSVGELLVHNWFNSLLFIGLELFVLYLRIIVGTIRLDIGFLANNRNGLTTLGLWCCIHQAEQSSSGQAKGKLQMS